MLLNTSFIYAFISLLVNNNKQIQILKLQDTKNYYFYAIYIQATLKSKACWDIIDDNWKRSVTSITNILAQIKKTYQDYI